MSLILTTLRAPAIDKDILARKLTVVLPAGLESPVLNDLIIVNDREGDQILLQRNMDHHFKEQTSLKPIARKLNISSFYLSHVFSKGFGDSPHAYLIKRRIGEIQTLPITAEKSITNIAYKVGFNSVTCFQSSFKKKAGITPGQYRRDYIQENGRKNLLYKN